MLKARRRDLDQPFGQLDRGGIRRPKRRHVRDALQLFANRRIELWVSVTMNVAPHAARAIQILVAVDVDQRATAAPLEDKRLILAHLGEGVPDDFPVPALEFRSGRFSLAGGFTLEGGL